jgi:hypothetical protein
MNSYGGVVVALVLLIPVVWAIDSMIRTKPPLGGHQREAATIVVFGILAALAIPTYESYVLRKRIREMLKEVEPPKSAINDYFRQHARFPPTVNTTGLVRYDPGRGTLVLRLPKDVLDGKTVVFTPIPGEGGQLGWSCGGPDFSAQDRKLLPEHCR